MYSIRARQRVIRYRSSRAYKATRSTTPERLKNAIAAAGISITYSADIAPAHGLSRGGAIALLPGLPAAEEFSVLIHEFAHERLHKGERRTQTSKTVRETEAEAVGFRCYVQHRTSRRARQQRTTSSSTTATKPP